MNTPHAVNCPLCHHLALQFTRVVKFSYKFTLFECVSCGLKFQYPQPRKNFYNADYYSGQAEYSYIDERDDKVIRDIELTRRLKNILKFLKFRTKKIRLLDVGCAHGALVRRAREMGMEAQGYDISPVVCGKHIDICTTPIADGPYDIVTLIETIEHMSDPGRALRNIHRGMNKHGILVIQTANFRSWLRWFEGGHSRYFLPGHTFYFSDWNLSELLESRGFEIVKIYHAHETGLVPAIIRKMLTNMGRHKWNDWLTCVVTITIHLFSKLNILMPVNGGMVIYARKK